MIFSPSAGGIAPELAVIAGFALARGITAFWIGRAVPALMPFLSRPAVRYGG